MRSLSAVALLAGLLSWVQAASSQPFSQVIVFGDSNVDSGFYKILSSPGGGTTYNSDWPTGVAHGAGAPTTNPSPMNTQMLAGYFGRTANPSNAGGTNSATSGAKNATVNSSATGGFTAAVPTVTQIANYLSAVSNIADGQALYLVYSGDNDIKYALGLTGTGPWPADPNAYMTTAAQQLTTAIGTLSAAGAKTIIVSGIAYDYPTGTANATERALKLFYTQTLWSDLTAAGVSYVPGDIDKLRLAISANPSTYGFSSVSNSAGNVACTQPAGVTTAWALLCSSDPAAPSTYISATAPQTQLFADDQHLGTAGQRLVSRFFKNLVVPWAATHDYNGDGKSDIIWRDGNGNVSLWIMNGGQTTRTGGIGLVDPSWSIVAQRDFNSDGEFDLLWHNTNGNTAIWFMNGAAVTSTVGLGTIPTVWTIIGTGDFNSDGFGDILWQDTSGNLALWLMGSGGQVMSSASLGNVPPSVWSISGIADFNGDGKSDILWRDTSGNLAMWLINGTVVSSALSLGNVPITWLVVGTGDFDNDGRGDILWRDGTGSTSVWLMNGATIASSGGFGVVPIAWSVASTGDYNGDGKSDILWRDTSTGDTVVWFMNGTAVSSSSLVGNIGGTWTVQDISAD